jgi:hypothetical protein
VPACKKGNPISNARKKSHFDNRGDKMADRHAILLGMGDFKLLYGSRLKIAPGISCGLAASACGERSRTAAR